jgi:hypothetical protein
MYCTVRYVPRTIRHFKQKIEDLNLFWHEKRWSKTVLWIRIRMDPHSFGCLWSGSRNMKIDQNLQINMDFAFRKGFCTFVPS